MESGRTVKSAWVVTWQWMGNHARVDDEKRFVTALNYRWTTERVRALLEQLYIALEYSPWDKAGVAKNQRSNPYPAKAVSASEVHCGHNPWLRAQRVRNLSVTLDGDGTHKLSWYELPHRSRTKDPSELVPVSLSVCYGKETQTR